jgi:hypothetical protein
MNFQGLGSGHRRGGLGLPAWMLIDVVIVGDPFLSGLRGWPDGVDVEGAGVGAESPPRILGGVRRGEAKSEASAFECAEGLSASPEPGDSSDPSSARPPKI